MPDPGHGGGTAEEGLVLCQRADDGQGGLFSRPLVGNGDDVRLPEDSLGFQGQKFRIPGTHANTI